MGNEDADLVTVKKFVKKKSLLERYDIPIEHLSYEYVTRCTGVKELERIVLILRSGEEGIYPDLTKYAEERLAAINPQSAILRVAEPVLTKDMLAPEKRMMLENDINQWMTEMKSREKDLDEGRATLISECNDLPDIRQIKLNEPKKKQQPSDRREKCKRIGACDYAGWDKYDADTEINRIDLQLEKKQAEAKKNKKKLREKEEKIRKESSEAILNKLTLTGTELTVVAEQEREKGNEAFKACDYEEALQFYNSSISIDATINAYNNRAITCIKLQRYDDAVSDCNRVISEDQTNIKALLRRGLALEHLEKTAQALADYEAVLKIEPTNKVAINALNKLRAPCDSKRIRMKIEEGSTTESEKRNSPPGGSTSGNEKLGKNAQSCRTPQHFTTLSQSNTDSKSPSDSLNSTSVESTSQTNRRQICFCNNAPSSSQHFSPLPHIRDAYCSKTIQKSTKFPKYQSIFTDSSIFTDTRIPAKKSSVVIEEIPNEVYDEPMEKLKPRGSKYTPAKLRDSERVSVDFGAGDNEGITKKSATIIEEIPNTGFAGKPKETLKQPESTNEETKKLPPSNAPNFGTGDNGTIGNLAAGISMNEIPKKKDSTKLESMNDGKIDRIKSPYEFLRLWHSLKNDPELILHGRLLKALAPDDFDTGNKLDGEMLSTILRCLERHFFTPEDTTLMYRFLQSLAKLKRFSIVKMFIDENDRKVLQTIFALLEAQGSPDSIQDLRKAYNIPM